mgnify:CR=1 FL=1
MSHPERGISWVDSAGSVEITRLVIVGSPVLRDLAIPEGTELKIVLPQLFRFETIIHRDDWSRFNIGRMKQSYDSMTIKEILDYIEKLKPNELYLMSPSSFLSKVLSDIPGVKVEIITAMIGSRKDNTLIISSGKESEDC